MQLGGGGTGGIIGATVWGGGGGFGCIGPRPYDLNEEQGWGYG